MSRPSFNIPTHFGGADEHELLVEYPPQKETLWRAQDYILEFIRDTSTAYSHEQAAKRKAHFLFSIEHSMVYLPNYATLDYEHIVDDIGHFKESVLEYKADTRRSKPLNWVIRASPGEGKSHFIECVAKKLDKDIEAVFFNMATMRSLDDLAEAIDQARNKAVKGRTPLLFLDEFDCVEANYSLLLPLLWDGKIELGARRLVLGRAIIVLAGSKPAMIHALTDAGSRERKNIEDPHKLVDLVSRISGGVIKIPDLEAAKGDRDRRVDKVCVAIALLRVKYETPLRYVPARLLEFVYNIVFKHGVRSIQHLIDSIGITKFKLKTDTANDDADTKKDGEGVVDGGMLDIARLDYIFEHDARISSANLDYHLFADAEAHSKKGIKELWREASAYKHLVPVWCEVFEKLGRPSSWKTNSAGASGFYMVQELEGNLNESDVLDVSTYAAIEPYNITELWLNKKNGEWNHGSRDMRHVFFNLGTLQQLLLEVTKEPDSPTEVVEESDSPTDDSHRKKVGRRERVGHRMGIKFGRDFVKLLPQKGEQLEDHTAAKLIDYWCQFDISGGWGKWAHEIDLTELHVYNNFLAVRVPKEPGQEEEPVPEELKREAEPAPEKPGQKEKSPFCAIMEGYIQGVLEEIMKARYPEKIFSVTVDEAECGIPDPKNMPCRFKYTLIELDVPTFNRRS